MSNRKASQPPTPPAETDLPEGWTVAPLHDVCEVNPGKPTAEALPGDAAVTFVPMPAVDAESGTIASPTQRPFAEARRGSYTPFAEGDVLIAKITPCMENGKAAVARHLLNGLGFGSTEFHVLRSRGGVLPDYVYRYVSQQSFREEAKRHMSGNVGQQRVPAGFIKDAEMPIPPLSEQKRIVGKVEELLGRVNGARARLAKGFRGELVPTEAELARAEGRSYESAAELLARIRAERGSSEGRPAGSRAGTRAARKKARHGR